jgi:hypothetical protein
MRFSRTGLNGGSFPGNPAEGEAMSAKRQKLETGK